MKVLLITAYFPPDTGSAAHLFYELGTALVGMGHRVTVLTSFPSYHAHGDLSRYQGKRYMEEDVEGIHVVRVRVPQFPRHIPAGRALWQFSLAFKFGLATRKLSGFDVSIVYSPPLPLGYTAWYLKRRQGVPFIFNVQDLFPQSIIDLGILKSGFLIRFFESMERWVYDQADLITVHSPGNRDHVVTKGASPEKVEVIPNWVDTDFITPGKRMNSFREEFGLGDRFIVSFAGVLGYSQDIDVFLEAADLLRDKEDILFLIVGDGVEKERLQEKARSMHLTISTPANSLPLRRWNSAVNREADGANGSWLVADKPNKPNKPDKPDKPNSPFSLFPDQKVIFLPMQPRDRYPSILHASDICLATLHAEVRTPVVPSKILSIMAAGRPVIACMNLEGDAPRLVEEAGCGYVLPPEDPRILAEHILKLYEDQELREEMGRRGRAYAEKELSLTVAAERYIRLIERIRGLVGEG